MAKVLPRLPYRLMLASVLEVVAAETAVRTFAAVEPDRLSPTHGFSSVHPREDWHQLVAGI